MKVIVSGIFKLNYAIKAESHDSTIESLIDSMVELDKKIAKNAAIAAAAGAAGAGVGIARSRNWGVHV